jgi:hypothetical protein
VGTAVRPWYERIDAELVIRIVLCAVGVLLCYCFRWEWLRYLTSELNMRLDDLAGVHLERVAKDVVLWRGEVYWYTNGCAFADVWCGAIPLVWNLRRNIAANLLRIAIFSIVLLIFNVVRLSFSDILFAQGVPWWLAHEAVAGVAYFVVLAWIWETRSYARQPIHSA